MSASLALSSMALANSSIALAEASHAADVACQALVGTYNATGATREAARAYAECVMRIYPDTGGGNYTLIIKTLIVMGLLGIPVGMWVAVREFDDWTSYVLGGLFGAVGIPCIGMILGGIVYCVMFLFS
jgi:hypothetical protein